MRARNLDDTERVRLEGVIGALVGPAPWYLPTFPPVAGHSWVTTDPPDGTVHLMRSGRSRREHVLVVPMYGRALLIATDVLLMWVPDTGGVDVRYYDVRGLGPVDDEVARDRLRSVVSAVAPIAALQLPGDLPAGRHLQVGLDVPGVQREREIFLIVDRDQAAGEGAVAIYVWRPAAGTLDVRPQRWFTGDRLDLAYQWITRSGRDPVSGRIVGDGIRVGCFELDGDGTDLAEFRGWLGWEWRPGTGPEGAEPTL